MRAIADAHDGVGATNSRGYRVLGEFTEPQPRKSPRSIALRSHAASGRPRAGGCENAGTSSAGRASSRKNDIRLLVLTAWYLASMCATARPSLTTLRATTLRSSEK